MNVATLPPHNPPASIPDIGNTLDELSKHEAAKLIEQIGMGMRTALGIGALALLPDLIDDLRRSKDPDVRLKFVAMALKDGGFGAKENKNDNLPTFSFTFHAAQGGTVIVEQVSKVPTQDVTDAVIIHPLVAKFENYTYMNDDVADPETQIEPNFLDSIQF